jgi:hypothetical protein
VCIANFPCFSMFLYNCLVLKCAFLIFHVFQFSRNILDPRECISYFLCFFSISGHIPGCKLSISHFPSFFSLLDITRS